MLHHPIDGNIPSLLIQPDGILKLIANSVVLDVWWKYQLDYKSRDYQKDDKHYVFKFYMIWTISGLASMMLNVSSWFNISFV